MSGISFLTLATGSGAGASGAVAGVFGVSLMGKSIHHAGGEKGSYSKASREERSGYVFWHEVQVRK